MAISEDPEMEVIGVAANGRIALAMLEQKATDLVTLDLEMPEMDGLTMLQHLRQNYTQLPVLIFSGATAHAAAAILPGARAGGHRLRHQAGHRERERGAGLHPQQLIPAH